MHFIRENPHQNLNFHHQNCPDFHLNFLQHSIWETLHQNLDFQQHNSMNFSRQNCLNFHLNFLHYCFQLNLLQNFMNYHPNLCLNFDRENFHQSLNFNNQNCLDFLLNFPQHFIWKKLHRSWNFL